MVDQHPRVSDRDESERIEKGGGGGANFTSVSLV